MPKLPVVVDAWMNDPAEPKPADILAALLDFREFFMAQFARMDTRFENLLYRSDGIFPNLGSRIDGRFDRIEQRLATLDDRFAAVADDLQIIAERLSAIKPRRKR